MDKNENKTKLDFWKMLHLFTFENKDRFDC